MVQTILLLYLEKIELPDLKYNLNNRKSIEVKDFLLSIFGSVPFGLIILDYNGIIKIINEQAVNFLGISNKSVNALINTNIITSIKELTEFNDKISNFLHKKNNPFHIEMMICKDKILSIKGDQHLDGLILTIEDVTQREYYLSKILKQTTLLKDVENLSNIGIWNWEFVDKKLTWTDGLYSVFGLNPKDGISIGKYIDMVHPNKQESILKRFNNPSDYKKSFSYDETIINSDGVIKFLKVWGNIKLDTNKLPIEMYGVSMDFTERTEIEKREKQRTKELEVSERELHASLDREKELSRLKSHFVSTASHQFRTPLAIIQSNSELLEMQSRLINIKQIDKVLKPIQRIKNGILEMTNLMDEVLVLGKISSGSIKVNLKPLNIISIITDIIEQFNSLQTDGRVLEFKTQGKQKIINGDALLINHALNNLISNAFKYSSHKNPKLDLIFKTNEVIIEISDEGIGIPKKSIKNLFTPFYRSENVMDIPGTGLGLSIAKEYIELNNGEINVKSEENKGSKFLVKFLLNNI